MALTNNDILKKLSVALNFRDDDIPQFIAEIVPGARARTSPQS